MRHMVRNRVAFSVVSLLLLVHLAGCRHQSHSRDFQSPPISQKVSIQERDGASASAMASGGVTVVGGFGADGSTLDAVTVLGADNAVSNPVTLDAGRARHGACVIDGGARVVVAGGVGGSRSAQEALSSTRIVDPVRGTVVAGPDLPEALVEPRAVFWDNGTPADLTDDAVFLIGGLDASGAPSGLVLKWTLSPAPGSMGISGNLATSRSDHTITLCPDHDGTWKIWVIGGDGGSGPIASTELIDPATARPPWAIRPPRRPSWSREAWVPHSPRWPRPSS